MELEYAVLLALAAFAVGIFTFPLIDLVPHWWRCLLTRLAPPCPHCKKEVRDGA